MNYIKLSRTKKRDVDDDDFEDDDDDDEEKAKQLVDDKSLGGKNASFWCKLANEVVQKQVKQSF